MGSASVAIPAAGSRTSSATACSISAGGRNGSSLIVDRARRVEDGLRQASGGAADEARTQLTVAARRARLTNASITLGTIAALLVALVIAMLFASTFVPMNLAGPVAVMFVLAMAALIGSLLSFLVEVRVAIAALRIGPREKK